MTHELHVSVDGLRVCVCFRQDFGILNFAKLNQGTGLVNAKTESKSILKSLDVED